DGSRRTRQLLHERYGMSTQMMNRKYQLMKLTGREYTFGVSAEKSKKEEPDSVHEFRKTPYGEQDEYGNDVGDIRAHLKMTMLERLENAERAAKNLVEFLSAIKRTS